MIVLKILILKSIKMSYATVALSAQENVLWFGKLSEDEKNFFRYVFNNIRINYILFIQEFSSLNKENVLQFLEKIIGKVVTFSYMQTEYIGFSNLENKLTKEFIELSESEFKFICNALNNYGKERRFPFIDYHVIDYKKVESYLQKIVKYATIDDDDLYFDAGSCGMWNSNIVE